MHKLKTLTIAEDSVDPAVAPSFTAPGNSIQSEQHLHNIMQQFTTSQQNDNQTSIHSTYKYSAVMEK